MQTALSFSQGVLGIFFTLAGLAKFVLSPHQLGKIIHWTTHYPESSVRFIAVLELLGGFGLLLPWATGLLSTLAAFSAFGVGALMLMAMFHHLERREKLAVAFNLGVFVVAAFVVWGMLQ